MKNRDLFLPSLTTLVISGMMMFLSCAGREGVDNGDISAEAEQEQSVSDNGGTDKQNISDVTELTEGESQPQSQEQAKSTDEVTQLTANENAPAGDPTLDALGVPPEGGANAVGGVDGAAADASTGSASLEADKLALGAEVAGAKKDGSLDVPPSSEPLPGPDTANLSTPPAEDLSAIPSQPQFGAEPSAPHAYGGGRTPKIPTRAIVKKGVSLNRYYFLRKGDTAKSLAHLIYGDPSKAAKLAAWNGGKKSWKTGKLVYYTSPTEAEDGEMHSFYQERQVPSEDYLVKRGDWLSRIAQKKLGSSKSWKEVAATNGVSSPDSLEVGHKLAIYPADLSSFSFENQQTVAKNDQREEAPQAKQPPSPVVKNPEPVQQEAVQPPPSAELPTAEAMPTPPIEAPKKPTAKNTKLDMGKIVEQNLFAIIIGGGAIVLLLALSAINRRKRNRGDGDFNEDGFAPPTKLKRK